jgi:hypothetical protein
MKKFLICGIGLILCIAVGCRKDARIQKTYLLRQQVIDYRPANHQVDTITYTYDDHNRITMISEPTGQNKGNFSMTYLEDGRVNVAKRLTNSGAVITEYDFFYTSDSQGYYFHGPNLPLDTAVFIFNAKNQVIKVQSKRTGYSSFTYDGQGNVATSVAAGSDNTNTIFDNVTYLYDNQKNPFSDIPPNNYCFMYLGDNEESTLINNIKFKNGDTYTYTYNSDGFPINGNIDIGSAVIPVTFSYIVK